MAKHTPAPWDIKHTPGSNHYSLWDEHGDYTTDCDDNGEGEANARLIAAAPDMLAMLEIIVNKPNALWFDDAVALIAKAKGA